MPAVDVDKLTRIYRGGTGLRRRGPEVLALDGVSLAIEEGEVHGLLGPNGAGKTTLVKILSTVLLPTAGTARVLGFDVVDEAAEVRRRIGIVFGGDRGLYFRLSARQNLVYWAALYKLPLPEGRRRAARLLERVGLGERADEPVERFSRGMKRRLHLARGLIGDPAVLFLDEPTTGLDPVAARELRGMVGELRSDGRTILLTTHDMAEAEAVCDRVTLIDRGQFLATEPPRTLGTWLSRFERIDVPRLAADLVDRIAEVAGVGSIIPLGEDDTRIEVTEEGAAAQVMRLLVDAGVTSIRTSLPNLEEVYLHLFGDRGARV